MTQLSRRHAIASLTGAAAAVCCGDHAPLLATTKTPGTRTAGEARSVKAPSTGSVKATSTGRSAALVTPTDAPDGLQINPRSSWDAGRPPRWPMAPEDVKFLLVHHTASSNVVNDPAAVIRGVYDFHTSSAKGWPDVAYNFFVAPDGSVWEGRAGSLDGPVVADATGGNQGFSQLVCLIGNHVSTPPTGPAQESLSKTLAWLATRHQLSPWADANASFVSRGSNRFAPGSTITTPIISPHRSVTFTVCPGDAAVAALVNVRRRVFDLMADSWERPGMQPARRVSLQRP